jgi:hypothetical protein
LPIHPESDLAQRFAGLDQLCGAYLSQLWDYVYGTPEAAVLEFCAHYKDDLAALTSVIAGLDTVFAECEDERARLDALTPMGFNYWPGDGKLDAFLLWAREKCEIAAAGGELPRYRLPRSPLMESVSRFHGCYGDLLELWSAYFGGSRHYASPQAAIADFAETVGPKEVLGTYEALLMLHFDAYDDAEQSKFLSASGWERLPPDGELDEFLLHAIDVLAQRLEGTRYQNCIQRDMRPRLDV